MFLLNSIKSTTIDKVNDLSLGTHAEYGAVKLSDDIVLLTDDLLTDHLILPFFLIDSKVWLILLQITAK